MKFVEMLVKTFQKMGQNLEFISWTSRWVKYERNKAAFKNVTLCLLINELAIKHSPYFGIVFPVFKGDTLMQIWKFNSIFLLT